MISLKKKRSLGLGTVQSRRHVESLSEHRMGLWCSMGTLCRDLCGWMLTSCSQSPGFGMSGVNEAGAAVGFVSSQVTDMHLCPQTQVEMWTHVILRVALEKWSPSPKAHVCVCFLLKIKTRARYTGEFVLLLNNLLKLSPYSATAWILPDSVCKPDLLQACRPP